MLFVAKTATPAEGNWAGFWGTDVVLQHMKALFDGVTLSDQSRLLGGTNRRAVAGCRRELRTGQDHGRLCRPDAGAQAVLNDSLLGPDS